MRSLAVCLVAAVVTTLLSACNAYLQRPLTDPAKATVDPTLLGRWQLTEEDGERVEVTIAADGEHAVRIDVSSSKPNGAADTDSYKAHTSLIGEQRYLNVLEATPSLAARGFLLVKYAIAKEDELRVSLLNEEAVKKAITDGRLAGIVEVDSQFGDATITAAPASMAEFVLQHDTELFPDSVVFQRAR